MTKPTEEGLLSRWSRRKQQSEVDNREEVPVPEPREKDLPDQDIEKILQVEQVTADESPVVELTDDDMPPVESLTAESDFSQFMSSGVSDKLRNLALRKLFMAPVFNIRDGLDEYDEDYTTFEKLGDIVTCDMKHQVEMEAKKQAEKAEAEAQAKLEAEAEAGTDIEEPEDDENPDDALLAHEQTPEQGAQAGAGNLEQAEIVKNERDVNPESFSNPLVKE